MNITERISVLEQLAHKIDQSNESLEGVVQLAYRKNPWFTPANTWQSLNAIKEEFLNAEKLNAWISQYPLNDDSKVHTIGMVLAGNIPLVGWHDIMCCFVSGNKSMLKFSEKDNVLIPYLLEQMKEIDTRASDYFLVVDKLKDFDAVIATGSNNTSKYFEHYFGKYPNIIRANRNSVAVLTGEESDADVLALGDDIFGYFGLGCRNVSACFVKEGLDWNRYLEIWHEQYKELAHHNKYKNNFDHNISLFILNKELFLNNGCLIIKEDENIASRIASMHYQYYDSEATLSAMLKERAEQIQCVVAAKDYDAVRTVGWGQAQQPSLSDYADGVDTMQFLTSL